MVGALRGAGYEVQVLVRRPPSADDEIYWNPSEDSVDVESLEGAQFMVHLAGESLANARWTRAKKARIRDSRILGTSLLARAITQMRVPPNAWISASAIGYYGDRGNEWVDENSPAGSGFLAHLGRDWEASTQPAEQVGVRVVHARIGIVLAREGGALQRMKRPFQMGLGGRIGDGQQWMSWVSLEDLVSSFLFLLEHDDVKGPVNCVAPASLIQADFCKELATALKRPALLPVPPLVLRWMMGSEMAEELLIGGVRVKPAVLEQAGFVWAHDTCDQALKSVL